MVATAYVRILGGILRLGLKSMHLDVGLLGLFPGSFLKTSGSSTELATFTRAISGFPVDLRERYYF